MPCAEPSGAKSLAPGGPAALCVLSSLAAWPYPQTFLAVRTRGEVLWASSGLRPRMVPNLLARASRTKNGQAPMRAESQSECPELRGSCDKKDVLLQAGSLAPPPPRGHWSGCGQRPTGPSRGGAASSAQGECPGISGPTGRTPAQAQPRPSPGGPSASRLPAQPLSPPPPRPTAGMALGASASRPCGGPLARSWE